MTDPYEHFIKHLIQSQTMLYAYILSLVADRNTADDILQETNLVIWRKSKDFEPGSNFQAWVRRIAHFQVLAFYKTRSRDRHVFDVEVMKLISDASICDDEMMVKFKDSLHRCMERINPEHRKMLYERYYSNQSVKSVAKLFKRPIGSVYQTLYRVRRTLLECIETVLVGDKG